MDLAEIKKIVDSLPIPDGEWNRSAFIGIIEEKLQCKIHLLPAPKLHLQNRVCGIRIRQYGGNEYIIHESFDSDYNMHQIVNHEIGHLVLGHRDKVNNAEIADLIDNLPKKYRVLLPDLEKIECVSFRNHLNLPHEQDAERFGDMLTTVAISKASNPSVFDADFISYLSDKDFTTRHYLKNEPRRRRIFSR